MSRHASTRRLGSFAKSRRLESLEDRLLLSTTPAPDFTFDTITFEDEFLAGPAYVPPDPHGAAGPTHVVNVVNSFIEWHTKTGITEFSASFTTFFTQHSTVPIISEQFDPKILYDQYNDRFVMVALEKFDTGTPLDVGNLSRIWVAVSDDNDPNGDWYVQVINSKEFIPPFGDPDNDIWFDYPGFAVDEEAIYITGNMFTFPPAGEAPVFAGSRLYILGKTNGPSGGFYNGGTSSVTRHDPSAEVGFGQPALNFTLQPAHTYGNVPSGVGTFLVTVAPGFGDDFVGVYRIDNPLTNPTFSRQTILAGDVHGGFVPSAPQAGSFSSIDFSDGRALEAVWRDNALWGVSTVTPNNGPDAGQATVHWFKIDTSDLSHLTLADQGNVGGEDIAPTTYTGQASIAVNAAGDLAIGFAASSVSIHPGAYYTIRLASDPAGTVRSSAVLAEGDAVYDLGFRWGDYTGIAVDPEDDATFWVFNEYSTSATLDPDFGIWATRFGRFDVNGIGNVAPVANDDEATTEMDTAVLIDVVANDTDANVGVGDQVMANTVTIVTPAAHGSTVVNPINGEVTYTPAGGFFGTDTFQYTVDDFFGLTSNAATVTVNVTDTRPTAVDDSDSTAVNTLVTIDVLANDFDYVGGAIDPTSVMIMTPASFGATFVNVVTGEIMYQPNAGFTGGDSFTYRVRDDDGNLSNEATVLVRVGGSVTFAGTVYADINNDGVKNGNEIGIEHVPVTIRNDDVGFSITVFTDADGDYALAESPDNDLVLPEGTYSIIETQPIPYHDGIDTSGTPAPTSTANDQFNGIFAAAGTAVTGYNFGERGLRAEFFDAYLNGTLYMMYSSPGVDGWHDLYGLNPAAAPVWVAFNDGTEGQTTFGATFGGGSVALGVYDANLNLITATSSASGQTQIDYTATSGVPYFLKVSGSASAVNLDIAAPDVDPEEGGPNSPPVFNPIDERTVDEGAVVTFQITAVDPEGDDVRYFLDSSAPAGASINPTTGWFTWATDEDSPATTDFVVLAIDDGHPEQIAQTTFQINVSHPNTGQDTPLAVSGPANGETGQPQSFTFTLLDPLPGDYLFVIDWDGDGGFDEAVAGTSGLTADHVFADAGSYTVRAAAVDPLGNWSEEAFHAITINEPTIELATVVDVYVAGSNWSETALEQFESEGMGIGGYSIMPGSGEETQTLGYGGIDKIKIVFSDDVAVTEADLQLAGVNVPDYAFEPDSFSYDPATQTATWTLVTRIGVDKLALRVAGSAEEFQLRFNVTPGDATGDGRVDLADFTRWADSFQATGVQAADFTVDGVVDIADFTYWVDYAYMELPISEPAMPSGVSGGGGGGGGTETLDAAFSDWETSGIAADDESANALAAETSAAVVANDQGAMQPANDELGWIMMCIFEKATDSGDEEEVVDAAH